MGRGFPSPPPPPLAPSTQTLKHNLPTIPPGCADPGQGFWARFPFHPLPQKPSTVINVPAFEQAIDKVRHLMSPLQADLARMVINDLKFGADTLVDLDRVPREIVGNKPMKPSSVDNCTDQLASMVKDR